MSDSDEAELELLMRNKKKTKIDERSIGDLQRVAIGGDFDESASRFRCCSQ